MLCHKRKYPVRWHLSSISCSSSPRFALVLASLRASLRRPLRGGFAVLDRHQRPEKPLLWQGMMGEFQKQEQQQKQQQTLAYEGER
jgi:hypothetical protein